MKYILYAEPVDGCQMSCALCWNRDRMGSMENMSLDIVREIVKKHGHVALHWYNWGEPLLHKDFVRLSEIINGAHSYISSNFSLRITDAYFNALTNFKVVIVSISGMTQDVYEIYHKGGNLNLVLRNLERFLKMDKHPPIVFRWLVHSLNKHQRAISEEYCKEKGIKHSRSGLNCDVESSLDGFEHNLLKIPKFNPKVNKCPILERICVGADGSYLLCCASRNVKTGYNVFDDISMEELLKVRMGLELCKTCREKKLFQMYG